MVHYTGDATIGRLSAAGRLLLPDRRLLSNSRLLSSGLLLPVPIFAWTSCRSVYCMQPWSIWRRDPPDVQLNRSPKESPIIPNRGYIPEYSRCLAPSQWTDWCLHLSRSLFTNSVGTNGVFKGRATVRCPALARPWKFFRRLHMKRCVFLPFSSKNCKIKQCLMVHYPWARLPGDTSFLFPDRGHSPSPLQQNIGFARISWVVLLQAGGPDPW